MQLMIPVVLTVLFLGVTLRCSGKESRVASPDDSLVVILSDRGGLHYRVEVDEVPVVAESRLGLALAGDIALGPASIIQDTVHSQHDGSWQNHFGKRTHVRDCWNQLRITLREPVPSLIQLTLVVRVHDDGVAFRYELDSGANSQDFVVVQELTEFHFTSDYRCWAGTPSHCAENTYPDPNKPTIDFEKSEPHIDLPELLDYAKHRSVKLIIWLHSDDLNTYGIDRAFNLVASWGAAGVKIDFLNSDNQETVAWSQRVLEAAARRRLLVDFHGVFKPTGLARTWPNYITQEGVLGNEYNKLDERCTPQHTIMLPFTRGLLGPMDFTPGGFLNRATDKWKMTAPTEVMGTRARQLAMTVVYESPLLVLCDSPKNYRRQPGVEFFQGLPTVWDESVVLSAQVGKSVALARRSGKQWWIAAMNGPDAAEFEIPLAFLGIGKWQLRSFADGDLTGEVAEAIDESTQRVSSADTLRIELAPAGGFAGVSSLNE